MGEGGRPSVRAAREGTVAPPPPRDSEERGAGPSQGPAVSVRGFVTLDTAHGSGLSCCHSPLSACGLRPPAPTPRAPTPRAPSRMRPISCLPAAPTTCSRLLHFAFCICNCDSSQGSCHPVTSRQGATVVSGPSPTSSAVTATDKIQGQVGGRRFLSVLLVSAEDIVVTFTET